MRSDSRNDSEDESYVRYNEDNNNNNNDNDHYNESNMNSQKQHVVPKDLFNEFKDVEVLEDVKRIPSIDNQEYMFNASEWSSNLDPAFMPILNNAAISGEWPGAGLFTCPYCMEYSSNSYSSMTLHINKVHSDEVKKYGFW
ncbi:hypothetical protein TRFO_39639 [Tritrichomonas foetus]|uniref:Uncharacterized protein n=1 Tax=Tritrichomonas foetus TaxID=1144522 RepID=A0A1J4J3Y0_9EUKA|nr:hypothetical protein TRFO_39639 [Tritrichomonas foetus]|eukprot:OHS94152.1 hypothetical protein TRFO_39639 [Tritrichomonas foetus]